MDAKTFTDWYEAFDTWYNDGYWDAFDKGQKELAASEIKLERIKQILSSTNKNDSLDSLQYIIHSALDLI